MKVCELLPAALVALKAIAYVLPVPGAGIPARVPVPFPLSVKDTPLGSVAPPSLMAGVGVPVVVTVNDPAAPTVNVAALALVITGAVSTVNVKV